MDAAQWAQHQVSGFAKAMEEIPTPNSNSNINPTNNNPRGQPMLERRARPQKDQNLNCPRCNSTNTKFCYYNNYSLTQPRYFCKTCRRYWTQGGSLRNVPVGGGSRKNKRSSSSSILAASSTSGIIPSNSSSTPSSMTTNAKLIPDLNPPTSLSHLGLFSNSAPQNPKFLQGQDLNLAFPIQGTFHPMDPHHHQFPKIEGATNNANNENLHGNIPTTTTTVSPAATANASCGGNNNNPSTPLSALELLRTGIASRGSLSSFVPMGMVDSNTIYSNSSGLMPNLQEFKPNNMGSVLQPQPDNPPHPHHHHENPHGSDHSNMIGSSATTNGGGGGARLLFPFADMNKLASSTGTTTDHHQQNHDEIDDQSKGRNDDHHHNNNHHQGPTGYWTGMLGGGAW